MKEGEESGQKLNRCEPLEGKEKIGFHSLGEEAKMDKSGSKKNNSQQSNKTKINEYKFENCKFKEKNSIPENFSSKMNYLKDSLSNIATSVGEIVEKFHLNTQERIPHLPPQTRAWLEA